VHKASGRGVIETYTVVHSRDGSPSYAIIYGKMENGLRFIAQNHPRQKDIFNILESQNQVGTEVILEYDNTQEQNLATFG